MEDSDDSVDTTRNNDPKLEKEFVDAREKALTLINEQLEIADKAITKAEKISEKYGIPFSSSVSPLGQSYTPRSYEEKFGALDWEELCESINEDCYPYPGGEYGGSGWEHSAVC